VRDERVDLFADSHNILARWRKHFSHLFDVHGVNDGRQREIHIAEPLTPQPSTSEIEMAIERVERHSFPDFDQIPVE
jgi:hypothetical protein